MNSNCGKYDPRVPHIPYLATHSLISATMKIVCAALLLCAALPRSVSAQPEKPRAGKPAKAPNELWNWTPSNEHHSSVTMLRVGPETGTGVVIMVDEDSPEGDGHLGFVATAAHVVESAKKKPTDGDSSRNEIRVYFANEERDVSRNCSIVRRDREEDVAIVWAWIPKGIRPVRLTNRSARSGDRLEFVGLGGKTSIADGLRHFHAQASAPTNDKLVYADQALLPGDSGGPVFDANHRLTGIISGGWFWWSHDRMKTTYNEPLRATWPARASNILPLARLIASLPKDDLGRCSASKSKRSRFKNENGELVARLPVPQAEGAREFGPLAPPVNMESSLVEWVPQVEGEIIYESPNPQEVIIYETRYPGSEVEYQP
ncbi:MAG: serine protease [Planctomycetota bacterium]